MGYGGSDQGDSRADGKKWSGSRYILNIEPMDFPVGLLVGFRRKREVMLA